MPAQAETSDGLLKRMRTRIQKVVVRRKFVRYSLLAVNVGVLVGIVAFVALGSPTNVSTYRNAAAVSDTPNDPLDQVSSTDIAVSLAHMANLEETIAVTNQADSASAEMAIPPAQTVIIAKPQAVATELKSRKDIISYTVVGGDTIASIASKFNVTSESILWSNNIAGNAVAVGTKLVIPPVTGIVYTVANGDTPDSLAQKYRTSKDQIIAYNDAEISGLKPGEQIIIPNGQQPITSSRSSSYGSGLTSAGNFSAVYGYNGYIKGYCTWYVANRRIEIGRPLPSNLGDAFTWDDRALAAGIRVDNSPAVGAAVVTKTSTSERPGHVAFVEAVNADGSVWISEMNSRGQVSMTNSAPAGGFGKVDFKLIPADKARTLNYIH
jgi:surface antigen